MILDGEVVAIDEEGRVDFWSLMRGQGHLAAFAAKCEPVARSSLRLIITYSIPTRTARVESYARFCSLPNEEGA